MQCQLYLPFTTQELYGHNWQYLLLVSPSQTVKTNVMKEKENFFSLCKQAISVNSSPHITVALFTADGRVEEALIAAMQSACNKQQKFWVKLCDFGGFDPSVIYIKIQDHQPFFELAGNLTVINKYLYNSSTHLVTQPHMTVARGIPHPVYTRTVDGYLNRSFSDSFLVHQLLLLKRRHEEESYKYVTTLPLPSWSRSFNN